MILACDPHSRIPPGGSVRDRDQGRGPASCGSAQCRTSRRAWIALTPNPRRHVGVVQLDRTGDQVSFQPGLLHSLASQVWPGCGSVNTRAHNGHHGRYQSKVVAKHRDFREHTGVPARLPVRSAYNVSMTVLEITEYAHRVFHDRETAERWLDTRVWSFHSHTPRAMLRTESGRAKVQGHLKHFEDGIFA